MTAHSVLNILDDVADTAVRHSTFSGHVISSAQLARVRQAIIELSSSIDTPLSRSEYRLAQAERDLASLEARFVDTPRHLRPSLDIERGRLTSLIAQLRRHGL